MQVGLAQTGVNRTRSGPVSQTGTTSEAMEKSSTRAKRWTFIFGIAIGCYSCAFQEFGPQTQEQLQTESTITLCNLVARAGSGKESILQELLRRHAISNQHVLQVRDGEITTGMNSCETIAAWGRPSSFSNSPEMDFVGGPSTVGVTFVYVYWMRGTVYFGADGLVKQVNRMG